MPTKIVQITDLHLMPPGEALMDLDVNERLKRVIDHAMLQKPDAYFLTGDFCASEPNQEIFHQLRPRLDRLGRPYYISPGNHDNRGMLRNAFYLDGHNDEPITGLVRVKNRDFLFLDTTYGKLDGDQETWLARAVRAYPAADIVMHHPPVRMGVAFMDKKYPLRDTDGLLKILTGDNQHRRVFCGHFHSARMVRHLNLEIHLCPPTSFYINPFSPEFQQDDLPPGYQLLEWFDDRGFRATPVYVPREKAAR